MSTKTILVVAGILVHDGHVFVAKRNPGGPAGGKWEFPGGKIEPGESPREALHRELKEELGLDVRVLDGLGVYETLVGPRIIALDCYWVTSAPGAIHLTSHSEFKWVLPSELQAIDFAEPDLPVVRQILTHQVLGT